MVSMTSETALKSVKVDRQKLIKKLKENRTKHAVDYAEAMRGYRSERHSLMKKLNAATAIAATEDNRVNREAVNKAYRNLLGLERPRDHSTSYDKAITLMEWTLKDKVKLSMNDFQCYVEDDWGWKGQFRNSVANYTKRA